MKKVTTIMIKVFLFSFYIKKDSISKCVVTFIALWYCSKNESVEDEKGYYGFGSKVFLIYKIKYFNFSKIRSNLFHFRKLTGAKLGGWGDEIPPPEEINRPKVS